jgi:putative transcriptional regulator
MAKDFFNRIGFQKGIVSAGKLLISEPFMFDENFKRTVIFLTEHNEKGSVGFILNKPSGKKLRDVLPEIEIQDFDLFTGGPVGSDMLFFLHSLGDLIPGGVKITDNIHWGGDFEILQSEILKGNVTKNEVRFFMGYSGWAPDQLTYEISENSWLLAKMKDELIMKGKSKLFWKSALTGLGQDYRVMANFPEDPTKN